MTEIVTFGEVLAEFMAMRRNQDLGQPGRFSGPYAGGAPAVFINQAARLGAGAALVSAVGDDAFGRMLVSRLAADGVDMAAVPTLPEQTTASAFVTYADDGSREFIFNIANGACAHIQASQFDAVLDGCQLFHVAGTALFSDHMVGLAERAAATVKAAGGRVSFDPNIRQQMLARPGMHAALVRLLGASDILLPSDDELTVLMGCASEDEAVARAFALGVSEIVLKRGSKGCRYHTPGECRDVPRFAATEVDPTGAGDTFGATFCTLRAQGMAAADALLYANAAGANAVSHQGAMAGTATRAQLAAFIAERSR